MEEQEQHKEDIEIKIKSIMLDSFEATDAGRKLIASLGDSGYEFQISLTLNIEAENTLNTTSLITLRKFDDKTELATMSLSMKFFVEDLDRFTQTNDKGIKGVHNSLAKLFAGVNISTGRGFFTVHSAQFNFRDAYLPIIDMNKFLADAVQL